MVPMFRLMLLAGLVPAVVVHAVQPCSTTLQEEPSPNAPDAGVTRLLGAAAISGSDVWAVGLYRACPGCGPFDDMQQYSLAMHYDGSTWSIVDTPAPANAVGEHNVKLNDVAFVSSSAGYAAGSYENSINTPDTFVLYWDGSDWEHLISPGQSAFGAQGHLFEAVAVVDEQNVWFGGQTAFGQGNANAYMVHYDGSNFSEFILPKSQDPVNIGAHRIRTISVLAEDDIWAAGAAGGNAVAVGSSYVVHWDGSSWSHVPTPHPGFGENLHDVLALAPDDVWVCGSYDGVPPEGGPVISNPLFLHWDGSSWTQHASPEWANDLVALAPDDIYGLGGNDLVHWDGTQWSVVDSLPEPQGFINLNAIAGAGGCDLIGVGMTSFGANHNTSLVVRVQGDPPQVTGDLDGDSAVTSADLALLLGAWGPCTGCPADLDGNGTVDAADLALLLGNWS